MPSPKGSRHKTIKHETTVGVTKDGRCSARADEDESKFYLSVIHIAAASLCVSTNTHYTVVAVVALFGLSTQPEGQKGVWV